MQACTPDTIFALDKVFGGFPILLCPKKNEKTIMKRILAHVPFRWKNVSFSKTVVLLETFLLEVFLGIIRIPTELELLFSINLRHHHFFIGVGAAAVVGIVFKAPTTLPDVVLVFGKIAACPKVLGQFHNSCQLFC